MKKGQKRGDGWKVAKDGSVTVQFKLNVKNKADRELLDQLQEWREQGQMTANMKKAIPLQAAVENGVKKIVDATWFKDVITKIDQWLSRPLPMPVDEKPAGPKPLAGVKPIAMPNFDEEDALNFNKAAGSDEEYTKNFLDVAFSFQENHQ